MFMNPSGMPDCRRPSVDMDDRLTDSSNATELARRDWNVAGLMERMLLSCVLPGSDDVDFMGSREPSCPGDADFVLSSMLSCAQVPPQT